MCLHCEISELVTDHLKGGESHHECLGKVLQVAGELVRSIPTTDGQIEELTKALKFFVECAGCSDVSVNHTEIPDVRH